MGKYLIENKILINIYDKNKESLLINTLSGRIDVLSHSEAECILRWEGKEICPRSIQEQELYY